MPLVLRAVVRIAPAVRHSAVWAIPEYVRLTPTHTTTTTKRTITNDANGGNDHTNTKKPRQPIVRVIRSDIHEPYFNIAFEERLFAQHHTTRHGSEKPDQDHQKTSPTTSTSSSSASSSSSPSSSLLSPVSPLLPDHTLFLWWNRPCVIMGAHQNPWKEVHLEGIRKHEIDLVRRRSGGGCVYQDQGNAIFTFVSRDTPEAKEEHNEILLKSLQHLGITAEASGRNDIEIPPTHVNEVRRKISGAAFKRERGWLLHHGTMLIDVDLQGLQRVLNPSKAKLLSKGVSSVAARVVNLRTIDPSITRQRWDETLAQTFRTHFGSSKTKDGEDDSSIEVVDNLETAFRADPLLQATYNNLKSFEWIYGSTPEFSHVFEQRFPEFGNFEIGFKISKGSKVEDVKIYSDILQSQMMEILKECLQTLKDERCTYSCSEIQRVLLQAEQRTKIMLGEESAKHVRQVRGWICAQM